MRSSRNWLITDTHFNHTMLIEAGYRPADFQQRIIDNAPQSTLPDGAIVNVHGHLHNGAPCRMPWATNVNPSLEKVGYEPVGLDEFVGFTPLTRKLLGIVEDADASL
jgi:calcineurin-like phosphoesterase family protein